MSTDPGPMEADTAMGAAESEPSASESVLLVPGTQGPLVGILTLPESKPHAGVLIVAGQPQTRIGAHRMFVTMSRDLAAQGIASLRFDCGGWGDSPGEPLPFEESAGDIVAAAAAFRAQLGPESRLIVFGLCDGASAAILSLDALRARGVAIDALCLLNPWVRAEAGHAEAILRTYYVRRLLEPDLWRRLLTGRIGLANLLAPGRYLLRFLRPRTDGGTHDGGTASRDLPALLIQALGRHQVPVWTILSGDDLTAAESEALLRGNPEWQQRLEGGSSRILRISGADHTLTSPPKWRSAIEWIAGQCNRL